jgi:hypothetical protein
MRYAVPAAMDATMNAVRKTVWIPPVLVANEAAALPAANPPHMKVLSQAKASVREDAAATCASHVWVSASRAPLTSPAHTNAPAASASGIDMRAAAATTAVVACNTTRWPHRGPGHDREP